MFNSILSIEQLLFLVFVGTIVLTGILFIFRDLFSWMLKTNDILNELKEIRKELEDSVAD